MAKSLSKLYPKDETADAYRNFFKTYSSEQVLTESLDFFETDMKAHLRKLIERDPEDAEEIEGRWKYYIGNLSKELTRLRKSLKVTSAHDKNLSINIGENCFNEAELAEEYLKAWMYRYESTKKLIDAVWVACKKAGGISVSRETIQTVHAVLMAKKEERALEELINNIAYDKKTMPSEALKKFEMLLRPAIKDPSHVALAAKGLFHFFWQVKRKLHGLPVENHLALIFISPKKGNGKSQFIRNLCRPFMEACPDFYSERQTSDVSQESKIRNIVHNYIVNFDDIKSPKHGDFTSFRSFVTAETVKVRPLYQNSEETVRAKYTGIGSANAEKIGDIYDDMQGERRLLGIETTIEGFKNIRPASPQDLYHLGHLTNEQYQAGYLYPLEWERSEVFWRLVDERAECQVSADELTKHQGEDKPENGIESFAHHYALEPGGELYPVKRMYALYKQMQMSQGNLYRLLNMSDFGTALVDWLHDHVADKYKGYDKNEVKRKVKFGQYKDVMCYALKKNGTLDSAYNMSEHDNKAR